MNIFNWFKPKQCKTEVQQPTKKVLPVQRSSRTSNFSNSSVNRNTDNNNNTSDLTLINAVLMNDSSPSYTPSCSTSSHDYNSSSNYSSYDSGSSYDSDSSCSYD